VPFSETLEGLRDPKELEGRSYQGVGSPPEGLGKELHASEEGTRISAEYREQ